MPRSPKWNHTIAHTLHSWGMKQATGHPYSRFCVFSFETLHASGQAYPCDSRTAKSALVTQRAGTVQTVVQEHKHAFLKIQQDRQLTHKQQ
jgi:hypothetical protein